MTLQEVINRLNLQVLTEEQNFQEVTPSTGYTSDLLSCVMAGAKHQGVWITLQAHINIVAVAALLDLSAVIITEGAAPDQATIDKANQQSVTLLGTTESSYSVVGMLWEMGLRSE